uniref:Type IV pilus assembly protein PilW n=1 Tax=mine drainage metagenome TaxID=410659 RepID=E6PLY6_9ZZZZ
MHATPARLTLPRQRGLTLVELMVALVAAIIFSLSVLLVQIALTKENVQMSDVSQRDNQSRAALDLITQDLSNSGFMLGGVQSRCSVTLAYNSSLTNPAFFQYPVSAASQPLPLPTSTAVGSPTYPSTTPDPNGYGSNAQFTDMLFFTGTTSALQLPSSGNPATYVVQNSTTKAASGQGALNSSILPLGSTTGISPGDAALLRMPLNGKLVCFRVPISNVGPSTSQSSTYVNSKSTNLFPSTAYSAFTNQLIAAGAIPPGGSLTNANFVQSRLTDLGQQSTSNQQTVVYYVGTYGTAGTATGSYPMLMRAVINAQNDTLTSINPVAAGVVSLQALFGVDETNSGGVTNYLTWPDVVKGNYTADVRSVLFAIVTKTLQTDPKYNAPGTITLASPTAGPDSFTNYTVPNGTGGLPDYTHNRFSVLESEVAIRNQIWPH